VVVPKCTAHLNTKSSAYCSHSSHRWCVLYDFWNKQQLFC